VNVPGAGPETYEELFTVCELTAEQKKKILDIDAGRTKATSDAQAAIKAAQDAVNKACAAGDHDAMNNATARYNAANKLVIEACTKGPVDPGEIDKVLTREQKAQWMEYTVLKSLDLQPKLLGPIVADADVQDRGPILVVHHRHSESWPAVVFRQVDGGKRIVAAPWAGWLPDGADATTF
jgi:hypothetical protein